MTASVRRRFGILFLAPCLPVEFSSQLVCRALITPQAVMHNRFCTPQIWVYVMVAGYYRYNKASKLWSIMVALLWRKAKPKRLSGLVNWLRRVVLIPLHSGQVGAPRTAITGLHELHREQKIRACGRGRSSLYSAPGDHCGAGNPHISIDQS